MREIASHLQTYFPNALYHVDYGSGVKLSRGQAIKQALLNGRRGHPDILVYEPRGSFVGLAMEVKRAGERVRKRDGSPASPHVAEQMEYLGQLSLRGWYTVIVSGAEDALAVISDYLDGKLEPKDQLPTGCRPPSARIPLMTAPRSATH